MRLSVSPSEDRLLIVAAIDVFQQTKDVQDLKDTLKRVARHVAGTHATQQLEVTRRNGPQQRGVGGGGESGEGTWDLPTQLRGGRRRKLE